MNQNKFGSRHKSELRSDLWLRILNEIRSFSRKIRPLRAFPGIKILGLMTNLGLGQTKKMRQILNPE